LRDCAVESLMCMTPRLDPSLGNAFVTLEGERVPGRDSGAERSCGWERIRMLPSELT
jgi:hypothetical protein